jgi:hypothetical protein
MSNVRVIRLDNINGQENIQVSSYEDAFEGYSNANGSKRRSNKIARIKGRAEVKRAKSEAIDERQQDRIGRKSNRKKSRQAIRQDKKNIAQENRQSRKTFAQEGRQSRLDTRKQRATDRRAYGQEEEIEQPIDETMEYPNENPPQDNGDYSQQEDSGYVDNSQQEESYDEPRPAGYNDSGVNRGQGRADFLANQQDNSADNYREEQLQDAGYAEEEDYAQDMGANEDGFNEEYGSLTGIDETNVMVEVQKVPKPVLQAVKGIQDHKNRITILMLQKEKGKTELPQVFCKFDGEGDDIDAMINTSNERIENLEGKIESYENANGVQAKRNVAVARQYCQRAKTKPTLVNPKLGAKIESQRIVVPPRTGNQNKKSSFNAIDSDGMIHPNYQIDIDGTQGRKFDIYSNADGTSGNMDIIKPIVIGAIVSIGAIYLVNYFKLIK